MEMTRSRMVRFSVGTIAAAAFAFFALPALGAGAPTVTTLDAVNVGQHSATLGGRETQTSGEYVIVWLEYGTNPSLSNGLSAGFDTISYPQSLDASFFAPVSSLAPGTTYYFRAVAKNTFGTSHGTIKSFSTTGTPPPPPGSAPLVTTNAATSIDTSGATVNGSVNPKGSQTSAWFEWGQTSSLGNFTFQEALGSGTSDVSVNDVISGLSPNTTYYFRAAAQNSFGIRYGSILSFTTQGGQPGSAPTVTTESATGVGQTFATMKGTVNPNGSFTNVWFEYGTSLNLGSTIGTQSIGSGNSPLAVVFSFQNLSPNTTYYFRAVAANTNGKTHGSILSFTTQASHAQGSAPTATTHSAFSVTQNSATLQGTVNPNGLAADALFEWGTSFGSLGNFTGFQSAGSGSGNVTVTASLTGLAPNTTYYFRIVGQNGIGTAFGSILSFTTLSGPVGGSSAAPSVGTNSTTGVGFASATVNGVANPNSSFTSGWFEYGTTQSLGNSIGHQGLGTGNSSIHFSFSFLNLSPNTTYYFRAVAQNSYGIGYGSILSFTTGSGFQGSQPSAVTYGATSVTQTTAYLQGAVSGNGSNATAWFEWGSTQSLGNAVGQQQIGSTFGSVNYATVLSGLSPGTTYYFRAVAQTSFGTSQGSIFSFTTSQGFSGFGNAPFVSTNGASFIETASAQLNSTVDPRGSFTNARFEWGPTPSLGNTTLSRDLGSGNGTVQFSWFVANLTPSATYYYRVVAQSAFGISPGAVVSFVTKPAFTVTPPPPSPVIQPPAPVIPPSLAIEPRVNDAEPAPGETIAYSIRYRNESPVNSTSRIVVRIMLPEGIEFVSGSIEPASQSSRQLTFNLGSLPPGSDGEFSLKLLVSKEAHDGESLVIGAVADWRDASNRSQSTSAYLTLTVNASGFLAALLGLDIPLGWILVAIVIALIAFFAARRIGGKPEPSSSHFTFKRASATPSH